LHFQIAKAANGKPFPGGFIISARKDSPSGAQAQKAANSAAGKEAGRQTQKNAVIEAAKAGAPIETGDRASKASAMIWILGHKTAAKAGRTGWQAIVDCAAKPRKLGGTQCQKTPIEAVKAGVPITKGGGVSKTSATMWLFSGGGANLRTTLGHNV